MNEIENFWKRINLRIKELGTTQNLVSESCGFSSRRLANLSSANRLPDAFEIVKIANVLHTSVEYLVTGNEYEVDNKIVIKKYLTKLLEDLD